MGPGELRPQLTAMTRVSLVLCMKGWNTRSPARREPGGSRRRGTRRSGRRGRRWAAHTAHSSGLLDSRQPSQTEVSMRRIGLAIGFVQVSALYHWRRIRKSATPRVDVSILFFLSLFVGSCLAFIVCIGAPARAQEHPAGKVYRIGFLRAGPPLKGYLDGFQQGLREWGYVYGENVVVEFRATDGHVDQLPQFAEDLVRMKVDVILASAASAAQAAGRATTSIPIVFVGVFDPVVLGLVPSLGRP